MNGHFGYRHDSFHCIGSAEQQKKKNSFLVFYNLAKQSAIHGKTPYSLSLSF